MVSILLSFVFLIINSPKSKNLAKLGLSLTVLAVVFTALLGYTGYLFEGFPSGGEKKLSGIFGPLLAITALVLAGFSFQMNLKKVSTKTGE